MTSDVGKDILDGLSDFARKLKEGEPIPVTEVRKEGTPDGPLHTRRRKILRPGPIAKRRKK